MNIFTKNLLVLTLCCTQLIASLKDSPSNIQESFFYGDIGCICVPLPAFGLGYRYQYNQLGLDLSVDTTPIYVANLLRISPAILWYPKPDECSEGYLGVSCGGLLLSYPNPGQTWNNYLTCLPELVVGYQYKRSSGKNNFFEFRLGAPIVRNNVFNYNGHCNNYTFSRPAIIPCASLKFGFGF